MFSPSWRRPKKPVHPEIWSHFQKTNKDGEVIKFRIQTLTEEYKEDVMDLFINNFMIEETFHASAGCHDCPEYISKFRHAADKIIFPHNACLICVLDTQEQKPKLVATNMCSVCVKGDEFDVTELLETEAGARLLQMFLVSKEMLPDVYQQREEKEYLGSIALSVLPEYRGMNISLELLRARALLCKAIGMKWTTATFTGAASQKLAERAGFKEDGRASYKEIEKAIGFKVKNNCEYNKLMSLKIE